MRFFNVYTIVTALVGATAEAASASNTTNPFTTTAICDGQTKFFKCQNPSSKLDIGVAIYGQLKNNAICSKKYERPVKQSCITDVSKNVAKLCKGKKSCKINTKILPSKCKIKGSKIMYVVHACRNKSLNSRRLKKLNPKVKEVLRLNRKLIAKGVSTKKRLEILKSKKAPLISYFRVIKLRRKRFRRRALIELQRAIKYHVEDTKGDGHGTKKMEELTTNDIDDDPEDYDDDELDDEEITKEGQNPGENVDCKPEAGGNDEKPGDDDRSDTPIEDDPNDDLKDLDDVNVNDEEQENGSDVGAQAEKKKNGDGQKGTIRVQVSGETPEVPNLEIEGAAANGKSKGEGNVYHFYQPKNAIVITNTFH